jgi:hypothetical protein
VIVGKIDRRYAGFDQSLDMLALATMQKFLAANRHASLGQGMLDIQE